MVGNPELDFAIKPGSGFAAHGPDRVDTIEPDPFVIRRALEALVRPGLVERFRGVDQQHGLACRC
jgi:hypothetical protein